MEKVLLTRSGKGAPEGKDPSGDTDISLTTKGDKRSRGGTNSGGGGLLPFSRRRVLTFKGKKERTRVKLVSNTGNKRGGSLKKRALFPLVCTSYQGGEGGKLV